MGIRSTDDASDRSPAERLREALAELVTRQSPGGTNEALTATALCDLAGVSRTAIYRYHPDVLHELHKIQRRSRRDPGPDKRTLHKLRDENRVLQQQVAKLAALVDHYYAAWNESRTLLERRERELAEVRRKSKANITAIRS